MAGASRPRTRTAPELPPEEAVFTCLDLATVSGVAYGAPGEVPEFETWAFKGASHDERYFELAWNLRDHINRVRPSRVIIEEPLVPKVLVKIGATKNTAQFLPGVVAVTRMVCYSMGTIPTELVERQMVLRHFCGVGRFSEENGAKRAVMVQARRLGWPVADDNQADAGAIHDYVSMRDYPRVVVRKAATRPIRLRGQGR